MNSTKILSISSFLLTILFNSFPIILSVNFRIQNNCPFTIWPASSPSGGTQLEPSETWLTTFHNVTTGRIWARTNSNFNRAGLSKCESGDCDGNLLCESAGSPPLTLAEFTFGNFNAFDISLVDGFNLPMEIGSISPECNKSVKCAADINGICPTELRKPGGCNNPCTVFKNEQFCCTSGKCEARNYSKFFKEKCPNAFTYPLDDQSNTFLCPSGTNFNIVFVLQIVSIQI